MKTKLALFISAVTLVVIASYHGWLNGIICSILVGHIPGTTHFLPDYVMMFIWSFALAMLTLYYPVKVILSKIATAVFVRKTDVKTRGYFKNRLALETQPRIATLAK